MSSTFKNLMSRAASADKAPASTLRSLTGFMIDGKRSSTVLVINPDGSAHVAEDSAPHMPVILVYGTLMAMLRKAVAEALDSGMVFDEAKPLRFEVGFDYARVPAYHDVKLLGNAEVSE